MPTQSADAAQTITDLQERYERLRDRKITTEANLKTAQADLDKLQREADEAYGTHDIDELKKQLEQMKRENEEKRASYQAALDKIDDDLHAVETNYFQAADATDQEDPQ